MIESVILCCHQYIWIYLKMFFNNEKLSKYAEIHKKNKGNAKHGVSPCLKIRPCDLDL